MAIYEQDRALYEEDTSGNKTIIMPVTRVNNVEGIGRIASTAYAVGDVVYVDNNKKVALKCTTGGTTSSSELDVSSKAIGASVTDGGVVWKVVNRIGEVQSVNGMTGDVVVDLPVGFMYFSLEKTVPVGRLAAQGILYNRTLYTDLWKYAQDNDLVISESEWQAQASANDGNCAFYSDGDGSTTFRVPSIKCWVKGTDNEEVGSYLKAGLPNIEGEINNIHAGYSTSSAIADINASIYRSGLISDVSTSKQMNIGNASGYLGRNTIVFDASNSNPIYGNADTVQPKTIVGQWLIVAFGTVSNVGNADVGNVLKVAQDVETQLNTKANRNALSMPSQQSISVSIKTDATYTAPADGWFSVYIEVTDITKDAYFMLYTTSTNTLGDRINISKNIAYYSFYKQYPMAKGLVYNIKFLNITVKNASFFYAKSEV